MPNASAESLTKRHELELARLRHAFGLSTKLLIGLGIVLSIALIVSVRLMYSSTGTRVALEEARGNIISVGAEWGQQFSDSQESYQQWLARRGTRFELHAFTRLSEGLFDSAASFRGRIEDPGILARVYLGLHSALLRVAFLLLASFRLWLVIIGFCIWRGLRPITPWSGHDALGQTGNGRLFFSGIRVALDAPTPDGAPSQQITGLACPPASTLQVVKGSAAAEVLKQFGATTTTNLRLLSIIDHHKGMPAYIAPIGEERALEGFFEGAQLGQNLELILQGALQLHAAYRGEGEYEPLGQDYAAELLKGARQGRKVSAEDNAILVVDALDRVLTPRLKEALALLDAASVATVILALEAGKSLAYAQEGGRWIRRSNFPQLSARAVLHSVPEFGAEYDFDLRATIRRALIFGSRSSAFAPVKFPLDFRAESRAARQWVEILMAAPHQLATVSDEVQLLGLVAELYQKWEKGFFEGAQALNPEVIDQVFATPQNLVFMPVARIVALLRHLTEPAELEQLHALVAVVSEEQRRRTTSRSQSQEAEEEKGVIPSYERIFPPFSRQELKTLEELHGVSAEDAKAWSSLRVVLNSFGWLGRRVADRSVPESSVVFAVSKVGTDFPGANALGLLGAKAVVPLRATRLEERWGKLWGARFMQVGNTRMAENSADFEKLMAGKMDEGEGENIPTSEAQGSGG